MITGHYSHRGIDRTPPPSPLDPSIPIIAQRLAGGGYTTSYIGKWHLYGKGDGSVSTEKLIVPQEHRGGFQSWIGYENNNSQYDVWVHGHRHDSTEIPVHRLPDYETDGLTDLLLRELDRFATQPDQPFFAVLSVQPPHVPNVAPPEDMSRHNPGTIRLRPNVPPVPRIEECARRELAGYYAQIENLDRNVGRILRRLRENNQLDDTLILFFSDHGDCMGSHGFREKSSPWEESIRIPLIIGGGIPYQDRHYSPIDAMISGIDLVPTTLGLAGLPPADDLPGFDFSPTLRLKSSRPLPGEPDSVFIQHTVRKTLVDGLDRPWRGVVPADGWKYVCQPGAPLMMFNLNEDPYEMANLAFNQRFIEKRRQLHRLLESWLNRTGDHMELPDV